MCSIKIIQTISAVLLCILFQLSNNINCQVMAKESRRLGLLGGYKDANEPKEDEAVMEAAMFVVESLQSGQGAVGNYSFTFPTDTSDNFDIKILQASTQVVAGLNFKLKIAIFVGPDCVGGLSAVVFRDLSKTLSVSTFGKEISCDSIQEMLKGEENE